MRWKRRQEGKKVNYFILLIDETLDEKLFD